MSLRHGQTALQALRDAVDEIARRGDADEIEAADGALDDVIMDAETRRKRRPVVSRPDSGIIPAALARDIASGAWRSEP